MYHNLIKSTFTVQGNCDVCKQRIEDSALAVNGVQSAEWNVQTGQLELYFDPLKTNVKKISRVIVGIGHNTEFDTINQAVNESLPDCCKCSVE